MAIEHIGIWTNDLEKMKLFYMTYFEAKTNDLYTNEVKDFKSYFLSFESGSRIELMKQGKRSKKNKKSVGYAHLAIKVGTIFKVIQITERLKTNGYDVISNPRHTGDGYFESVVMDPEGNLVEIMK